MAIEELHSSKDYLFPAQCVTTVAFLGALCFAILGIKIKWFRAQLQFNDRDIEDQSVQPRTGVYRSYGMEVFSPSYRIYDNESGPSQTSTTIEPIQSAQDKSNKIKNEKNDKMKVTATNESIVNKNTNSTAQTITNNEKVSKDAQRSAKATTKEEKIEQDKMKKEKEWNLKEEKKKKAIEKRKREKFEKSEKLKSEKERKEQIEREKKEKKDQDRLSKMQKTKSKQKPIIDNTTPNTTAQNTTIKQPSKMANNPLGVAGNEYEPMTNWDMVAVHRRGLQPNPTQPTAAENTENSDEYSTVNSLYSSIDDNLSNSIPPTKITKGRFSEISATSNKYSDTEA